MKEIVLSLLAVLVAFPAAAETSPLPELAPAASLISSPTIDQPVIAPKAERYQKVARNSAEGRLRQDLELQPSDLFTLEEEGVARADDFELKLPEEALPDSDIPLTLNAKVEYMVNFFQTTGHKAFAKWLSRSERYIPMMKQVLRKEGLPEDLVYLAMIESGFSPHAYSVASAVGPWQFVSGTGKRYSLRIDQWIDERRDPLKSTVAAAMYLKELYGIFNKDWYLAAAGYNAGENKILRAIDMYKSTDFWQLSRGSYLKRETKDYVPKLLAAAIIAKDPAKYGFADVAYLPPVEFDTVRIPSRTDLDLVAKLSDLPVQVLRELNPELRRWCTPPDYPNYELKVPKGKKAVFEAEYAKLPADQRYKERVLYAHYRAKKRDTLAGIAQRFGTTPQVLAELNNLSTKSKVRGRLLTVPAKEAEPVHPRQSESLVASAEKGVFKKYYTVQKGDTVASVSKKFNVSKKILMAWNNLKHRLALSPGKRIIVAKYTEKKGAMAPDEKNGNT